MGLGSIFLTVYSEGLVVLRDHTNRVCGVAAIVYQREQSLRQFSRKLDSEDGDERSGKGTPEIHLRVGKAQGYPWSYPTKSLAPCERFLSRGSNED